LKGKTGETPKQIEFDQHKIFIKAIHEKFKSLLSRPPIVPDSNSKDIKTVINYQKTQNTAKNSTETKQTETKKNSQEENFQTAKNSTHINGSHPSGFMFDTKSDKVWQKGNEIQIQRATFIFHSLLTLIIVSTFMFVIFSESSIAERKSNAQS
jgi:hypothetical protein